MGRRVCWVRGGWWVVRLRPPPGGGFVSRWACLGFCARANFLGAARARARRGRSTSGAAKCVWVRYRSQNAPPFFCVAGRDARAVSALPRGCEMCLNISVRARATYLNPCRASASISRRAGDCAGFKWAWTATNATGPCATGPRSQLVQLDKTPGVGRSARHHCPVRACRKAARPSGCKGAVRVLECL